MDGELMHYGILGMRWGIRRFQNEDGSYKSGAVGRYSPVELGGELRDAFRSVSRSLSNFGSSETASGLRNAFRSIKNSVWDSAVSGSIVDRAASFARRSGVVSKMLGQTVSSLLGKKAPQTEVDFEGWEDVIRERDAREKAYQDRYKTETEKKSGLQGAIQRSIEGIRGKAQEALSADKHRNEIESEEFLDYSMLNTAVDKLLSRSVYSGQYDYNRTGGRVSNEDESSLRKTAENYARNFMNKHSGDMKLKYLNDTTTRFLQSVVSSPADDPIESLRRGW